MSQNDVFRYFPDYKRWAKFTSNPCDFCNSEPSLEGIYFDQTSELEAVCLSCLISGKQEVSIPEYLIRKLQTMNEQAHPDWSEEQIAERVQRIVTEVARTPPVPWVQNNEWPICTDDFARYVGEADQNRLNSLAQNGDGFDYLKHIVSQGGDTLASRNIWEAIADEWATVFLFECIETGQLVAIVQTF